MSELEKDQLIQRLLELPELFRKSKKFHATIKADIRDSKARMSDIEMELIWQGAAHGKNAEERKSNMKKALEAHVEFSQLREAVRLLENDSETVGAEVSATSMEMWALIAVAHLEAEQPWEKTNLGI